MNTQKTRRIVKIETARYPNFALTADHKSTSWWMLQAHIIATLSPHDAWTVNKYPMFFDSRRYGSGVIIYGREPLILMHSGPKKSPRVEYCQQCHKIYSSKDGITREYDAPSGRGKCPRCNILLMPAFPDATTLALLKLTRYNINPEGTTLYSTEMPLLYVVPLIINLGIKAVYYTNPVSSERAILKALRTNKIDVYQIPTSTFAIPLY